MKTIILGPAGKMGRAMVACAYVRPDIELIGAVGPRGRDYIGKDIGLVCNLGSLINVNIHDCLEVIINQCDVVLDCTMPQVSMQALECCVTHRKAFVSGTTGFSDDQKRAFERAGETIPVLLATNTSKIFNLLFELIKGAASKIGRHADIDIIDMHDNMKLDAPSGTSKQIAEIISKKLDFINKDYTYGRNGIEKKKSKQYRFQFHPFRRFARLH